MFDELDCVHLVCDHEELKAGTKGVVVMLFDDPAAYEVEFFDEQHNTIAVKTVPTDKLERLFCLPERRECKCPRLIHFFVDLRVLRRFVVKLFSSLHA